METVLLLSLVFAIRTYGFGLYQVPTESMERTMLVGERFFADKLSYNFRDPRIGEIIAFNQPPNEYAYSDNASMRLFQKYVYGPQNWTKRVIGIPGDDIKGVIENGKAVIYRNGKKVIEPHVNPFPLVYVASKNIQQLTRDDLKHVHARTIDPTKSFDDQPFYRIQPDRIVSDYIDPHTPTYSHKTHQDGDRNYWDGSDEFHVALGKDEYWLMGDNRRASRDSRFFGPVTRDFIHSRILYRIWSIDSDESWWIVDLIKHPIDFWKRLRVNRFAQRMV